MSTWGKRVQRARRAGQRGIETTRRVVEQSGKSAALAGRKVANRVLGAQLSARLPSKLIDQSI